MIRTRFAPSPTGFLHVGGLRTALYNFLFTRKNKGAFVLRIEDTDQDRLVQGALEDIIQSLKICGIEYDEGPEKGGKFGPYLQSQRIELYKKYAGQLTKGGLAYKCYCSEERLEQMRQEQIAGKVAPKYDRRCLNLSKEEIKKHQENKTPFVIRFKIPDQGQVRYKDLVKKEVTFSNLLQEDFVMLKSDGYPTYHLANVVDDHLMEISHVIRGDEWLSSLPKHLHLYQALGWQPPEFAHIPLLLSKDRAKLSKRHGDVSVKDYLEKGYLPQALVNFVALLGWNPGTDEEIFDLNELINEFDISEINKAGAVFDLDKLDWMNGQYIRKQKIQDLVNFGLPYLQKAGLIKEENSKYLMVDRSTPVSLGFIQDVIGLEQERLKKLSDLPAATAFFFKKEINYPVELLKWKNTDLEKIKLALKILYKLLSETDPKQFQSQGLNQAVHDMVIKNGLKNGEVFWPWRVALTGQEASPSPNDISEILGKDETLKRISAAIKMIG